MTLQDLLRLRGSTPGSASGSSPGGASAGAPRGCAPPDGAPPGSARPGGAIAGLTWLPGPAAGPGALCDAAIVPVVTGRVDPVLLEQLAARFLAQSPAAQSPACHSPAGQSPGGTVWHPGAGSDLPGGSGARRGGRLRAADPPPPGADAPGAADPLHPAARRRPATQRCPADQQCPAGQQHSKGSPHPPNPQHPPESPHSPEAQHSLEAPHFPDAPHPPDALRAARDLTLAEAFRLLSGPGGLAAIARTSLPVPLAAAASLPLDIGKPTEAIPSHLRRAVIARDRTCRFPGCDQPPAACQVHHITWRTHGGKTALRNLVLMCAFHHQHVIHEQGWAITLRPDATLTATSPDGTRILHSHSPPGIAAA